MVAGILTTNLTHAIIHIALGIVGIVGIVTGWISRARGFCIFLGILLLAVGALWFVPAANDLIVRILNVNRAVALLNLLVGAVSLILGFSAGGTRVTSR